MKSLLGILAFVAVLAVVIGGWYISTQNRFVDLETRFKAKQVDNQNEKECGWFRRTRKTRP